MVSTITQDGLDNLAGVVQRDALSAESHISQTGVDQQAAVDQSGSRLWSEISQSEGGDNTATVMQRNGGKESSIIQDGDWHTALVTQTGVAPAFSQITQTGFGNIAVVTQ
jgi:hypothetical protein